MPVSRNIDFGTAGLMAGLCNFLNNYVYAK